MDERISRKDLHLWIERDGAEQVIKQIMEHGTEAERSAQRRAILDHMTRDACQDGLYDLDYTAVIDGMTRGVPPDNEAA